MVPSWPGVLCHLPALFGPSYYQNHQKLNKQGQLQNPLTAVSRAWYSRGHQVWTLLLWLLALFRPWVLSELILKGKACFLSLLAVNLECLTLHLWRSRTQLAGSSFHGLLQGWHLEHRTAEAWPIDTASVILLLPGFQLPGYS